MNAHNPQPPSDFDPDTYSDVRPGTNPEAFDRLHNEPQRVISATNLGLPGWAIALIVCVPLLVLFLALFICYLRRHQHAMLNRDKSPVELQERASFQSGQSIPQVAYPNYFPPAIGDAGFRFNREPLPSAHLRPASPTLRGMLPQPWQMEDEQLNTAFSQHRQRQQHQIDTDTDIITASDTYTMGPQSSVSGLASRRGRAPPPLAFRERIAEDDDFVRAQPAAPDDMVQPPPSSLQFPSAMSEMSAFPETELSHDPFADEVARNRRRT